MTALFQMLAQIFLSQLVSAFLFSLQDNKGPGASELEDKDIPTAKNSEPVTTFFGTNQFKGMNVLWFGDKGTSEIREEVFNNFVGELLDIGSEVVKGYKYYLSLWMGVGFNMGGYPIKLKKIRINDEDVYTNSSGLTTGSASINKPNLFTDASSVSNGWVGDFDWIDGTQTTANSFLTSKLGAGSVPPYKNLCHMVMKNNYIGNAPRLEKITLEVEHRPVPWFGNSTDAHIGDYDYNPIYALYFLLTDPNIGCDIDESLIDTTNFQDIAEVMKTEGIGISMEVSQGITYDSVKKTFEDIIDGFIDVDHTDGKYRVKLNRPDYDINLIDALNESDISSFSMQTTSSESLMTEYKVNFKNRSKNYEDDVAVFNDLGTRYNRGSMKTSTTQYKWIKDPDLATVIAARDLKPLSYPVTKAKIKVSQKYMHLKRGDVIKVSYPRYKLTNMVFRIGSIDYGNFDQNVITLDCVEDLFGYFESSYLSPQDSLYNEPDEIAVATNLIVTEMPYYLNDDTSANKLLAFAEKPNDAHINFQYEAEDSSNVFQLQQEIVPYAPYGTLVSDIAPSQNSFNINNTSLIETMSNLSEEEIRSGGNLGFIVNGADVEWISFRNIADNLDGTSSLTLVKRGGFHSTPKEYPAGTKVYFPSYGLSQTTRKIPLGESVGNKALTRTFKDLLDSGSAPTVNYTVALLNKKNLPCSRFAIAGADYGDTAYYSGYPIQWTFHIPKTQDHTQFFNDWATNYGSGTYDGTSVANLKIYEDNVLVYNNDISGQSYFHTPLPATTEIRYVLTNVTNGLDSESHDWTVTNII